MHSTQACIWFTHAICFQYEIDIQSAILGMGGIISKIYLGDRELSCLARAIKFEPKGTYEKCWRSALDTVLKINVRNARYSHKKILINEALCAMTYS